MATIVKTIGSAGGRDFSSIASWAAALPANLVTDGNSYEGDCYNDSEFSSASTLLTLSGHTTDATHTITLTTGAGQSFRDNANVQTNALKYNASNGVALKVTSTYTAIISISDANVFIKNLQLQAEVSSGHANPLIDAAGSSGALRIDNCIMQCNTTLSNTAMFSTVGSGTATITNSLFLCDGSGPGLLLSLNSGTTKMYFCTLVASSDLGTPPTKFIHDHYGTSNVAENCAFFGASAIDDTPANCTFTNCMTDLAVSLPTGVTGGKTFTGQFVGTTIAAPDYRTKTGADLLDAGTADATFGATDIAGTSRPKGSGYDIGAWELVVAAAVATPQTGWMAPFPGNERRAEEIISF